MKKLKKKGKINVEHFKTEFPINKFKEEISELLKKLFSTYRKNTGMWWLTVKKRGKRIEEVRVKFYPSPTKKRKASKK